jgi:hypothetical protein
MDASARRVHAERARRRLPPRMRSRRIGARLVGLIGTAGLACVVLAIALMVMPKHETPGAAALVPTPTPTPHHKAKPKKPKGPTKAQLKVRHAAAQELRTQGYSAVKLSDYDFKAKLRVLIGRRPSDGARWAFFFVGGHYIGHDALGPSAKLTLVKQTKTTVTLRYTTYAASEPACCPAGPRVTVSFHWDGSQLVPSGTIPVSFSRLRSG